MKKIITEYINELDNGNADSMLDIYHPNAKINLPSNKGVLTSKQAYEFGKSFMDAFPDLKHDIQFLIQEEDKVVMRTLNTATHKGEFISIAPTNRIIFFEELMIFEIKDGKIIESWGMVDFYGILEQLKH